MLKSHRGFTFVDRMYQISHENLNKSSVPGGLLDESDGDLDSVAQENGEKHDDQQDRTGQDSCIKDLKFNIFIHFLYMNILYMNVYIWAMVQFSFKKSECTKA